MDTRETSRETEIVIFDFDLLATAVEIYTHSFLSSMLFTSWQP